MKWFQHDADASLDSKVKKLIIRHGSTGYAVYIHCLELICGTIEKDNINFALEHDSEIIADNLKIDNSKTVDDILQTLIDLNLFTYDNNKIRCYKMAFRLDNSQAKNPEMNKIKAKVRNSNILNTESVSTPYVPPTNRIEENRIDKNTLDKSRLDKINPANAFSCEYINRKGRLGRWCKGCSEFTGIHQLLCPMDSAFCISLFNQFQKDIDELTARHKTSGNSWENFRKSKIYIQVWQICCNLERSKKLKEAGFPQKNLFIWYFDKENSTRKNPIYFVEQDIFDDFKNVEPICSAPTTDEILRELPEIIKKEGVEYYREIIMDHSYIILNYLEKIYGCGKTLLHKAFEKNKDNNNATEYARIYYYVSDNNLLEDK
jgi:hypothetical protein